jgi:hypothetical protein
MKADAADRRSREAMRKRREEQEHEAKERLRKEHDRLERIKEIEERIRNNEKRKRAAKKNIKDERSRKTAHRAREQQERDAQLRLAKAHVKAQQEKYVNNLENETFSSDEVIIDIGWTKKKGVAKCLFCDEEIKYYSFRCPDGGAIACNPCKKNMCRFTSPLQDEAEDDSERDTNSEEDGVDSKSVEDHETKAEEVPNGDKKHSTGTGTQHETDQYDQKSHEALHHENESHNAGTHENKAS